MSRAATHRLVVAAVVLAGCPAAAESGPQDASARPTSVAATASSSAQALAKVTPLPEVLAKGGVSQETFTKVCRDSPCSGRYARVEPFANERGEITLLCYHADHRRCSHGPFVYYDAKGNKLASVANRPMDPKSERGKKVIAAHAKHTTGLTRLPRQNCY